MLPSQDAVKKRLRALGACLCNSRGMASIFIVADLEKPGDRIKWLSCLKGCWLIDPQSVLTGSGPCLRFEPAIKKPLKLWVSKKTRLTHPALYSTLQVAINSSKSKWKLLLTKKDYMSSSARSRCAICCKQDISSNKMLQARTIYTKDAFLSHITRVRLKRLGLVGMSFA